MDDFYALPHDEQLRRLEALANAALLSGLRPNTDSGEVAGGR